MKYLKSNPHPTGKKIGDCVIRALAYAEAKNWTDTYQELCKLGLELYDMPNSKVVWEKYLLDRGWKKQKMPKHENGKRMKLSEFIDANPNKTFVSKVVGHVVYVEKGTLLDTWDCSRKCIGNFYQK